MTEDLPLTVPLDRLPEDAEARHHRLRDYFGNRVITCSLCADGWRLTLGWQGDPARLKDPEILNGLNWWSPDLTVADVPFAVRRDGGLQLALNDCWSLYAWSQWLAGRAEQHARPSELVLLHVDDHDDLMSPLIVDRDGQWADAITARRFSLLDPPTVASAIRSGAVGVGGFITPLLYHVPRVHVRHLCVTGYSTKRRGLYTIETSGAVDDLLAPGMSRQAIRLTPAPSGSMPAGHSYQVASSPVEWVAGLPDVPVLLHIDLDFFNNRYNGDSDWRSRLCRHDPPLSQMLDSVDRLFVSLGSEEEVVGRIVDITVAISPGFFPTEYWEPVTTAISGHVKRMFGSRLSRCMDVPDSGLYGDRQVANE